MRFGYLAAAVFMTVSLGSTATVHAQTTGGPNPIITDAVQVTPDLALVRDHVEPQIARDPKNGTLVIVEADVRGSRNCVVHISTDDGRSWTPGGQPLTAPFTDCTSHGDYGPYYTMSFDSNGILDMAIESSDPAVLPQSRANAPRDIFFARSSDDGRSFVTTSVFRVDAGSIVTSTNKGTTISIDPKNPDRIYVGWRQGAFGAGVTSKLESMIASSGNGGRTWGKPVDITDQRGGDYPRIAVTGDGVVHAVYWTRVVPPTPAGQQDPVRPIYEVSSSDHGTTFSPQVLVDPGNERAEFTPVLAADPNTGALYVVWSGNEDPINEVPAFKGNLVILFRRSTDGGKTWSARKILNDDPAGLQNHIAPNVSVAPNGRIDVAWYDARLSPTPFTSNTEAGFNDIFATSSYNGGVSFTPNVRISDRSSDRSIGVFSNNIDQRINVGILSSNNAMYVAWQDSRNGTAATGTEDVYTASEKLNNSYVPSSRSRSLVSGWLTFAAGLVLGLGVATAVGAGVVRRRIGPQ